MTANPSAWVVIAIIAAALLAAFAWVAAVIVRNSRRGQK